MDLMQIVYDIALVGLVSLTVIGVIAMTVLAAKAAKSGSHGCGPVETSTEELMEELDVENQRYLSVLGQNERLSRANDELYARIDALEGEVKWWRDNSGPDC